MAINDFSTLKQGVADWLARADLAAQIPTFISLAEADFNRDLRTRFQQVTVSGTMDDDFEFPADLQEIVSFRIVVGGRQQELFPYPPAALAGLINSSGDPSGYVVINDPTGYLSGVDYVMTYIQSIPALSDAAPQNWLILREPGLYLYGTLAHASPYLQDDNRALVWASIAKTMRESMKREDDNARYGNSPSQRIQGATP